MACQPKTMAAVVIAAMLAVSRVGGYPEGAPTDSCVNLTPNHGGSTTIDPASAPYTVTASKSTYSPGETITVTLKATGTQAFKGFLVEARTAGSTTALGTFTAASGVSRTLTCGTVNSAITHYMDNRQTNLPLTWTAPQNNAGTVTFRATFVQSLNMFYVGVQSSPLTYMGTQTTAVTTKSTSMLSQTSATTHTSSTTKGTTASTRTSTTTHTSSTTKGTTSSKRGVSTIRSAGGTNKAATVIANKTAFAIFTVMLASMCVFATF